MDVSLSEVWELVMDREDWRAEIHGITKSRTRLSDWTELKDVYVLISRTCEYITLYLKSGFADVTKLRILRWEDYPDHPSGPKVI